jgi:Tfp pilus assembly protein PilN
VIYLKSSVGIEIGQDDLLVSCLRSNFAGGVFTSFLRIAGYRDRAPGEVRAELDGFFKREKVSRENIVLGIPRKDVILRYLDFPKEVEDNLKQVVLFQVQSFEPTEEDKLYYDFVLLKNGPSAKKLHVLVCMIRKSTLDAHLQFMHELGIRPATITAGSVALANMFLGTQGDGRNKTFILADLRPGGIELSVLRNGAVVYARETVKPDETPWGKLLLDEMENAVGKVRMDPEETIEGIILAGEASENALQDLGEDMPGCELVSARLRFEMPPQNKKLIQEAATSLGLAYSGITHSLAMRLNLLPNEHRVHQKRWAYIPTIVLGLAVMAGLTGLGVHKVFQDRVLVRELDSATDELKPRVDRIKALKIQAENLEKQAGSMEDLLRRKDQNLEILEELTTLLPADSYLTMYINNDCTLTLAGQSPPSSAVDLIPKLEKSPLLKDVSPQGPIYTNAQTHKEVFTFTAKCEK